MTWNGEWFPSGRAEHRAAPAVEAAAIREAGKMIRESLAKADGGATNDVIISLCEMRDKETVESLVKAIGREGLELAIISQYRRRDRFDWQQNAILTTLPVVKASWSRWQNHKAETPPRGYAYAEIAVEPAVTARVYSVHLKSNYGQTTDERHKTDVAKRTHAVEQILEQEKPMRGKTEAPVIVAGDFNADAWSEDFADEKIFALFKDAKFVDVLESVPEGSRITHPGRGRWAGSTLDYIMVRDLRPEKVLITDSLGLSDHSPVMTVLAEGKSQE